MTRVIDVALRNSVRLAVSLVVAAAAPSHAQSVHGRTLSPDDQRGVTGVLVQLVDFAGGVVRRTVSRDSGSFRLDAPSAGTYRVRALRIGFRPTLSDTLTLLPGAARAFDLVLDGGIVSLSEVNVTDAERCAPTAGGPAAFEPWDEARKALELASLSAAMPYTVEMMLHERHRNARDGRVLEESARIRRGLSLHPFFSRPSDELEAQGYVRTDADSVTFLAPDAEVLLSPSFGATHCFRRAMGAQGEVVVAFAPVPDRQQPDIAGTIVLSSADHALRRVTFKYVNLPPPMPAQDASGFLEFAPIPSGDWIVRRWNIAIPLYGRLIHRTGHPYGVIDGASVDSIVTDQYRDVGGEVLTVVYRGVTLWAAHLPSLDGVLRTSEGNPVVDAAVAMPMLEREATTDSLGHFTLPGVPAGRHQLLAHSAFMDSLGVAPRTYDVSAGSRSVDLTLPTRDALFLEACDDPAAKAADYHGALLRGTVRGADGGPMPNVTVIAEWFQPVGRQVMEGRLGEQRRLTTVTDAHGRFSICGVSQYQRIRLRADSGSRPIAHGELFVEEHQRVALIDLVAEGR
jgi:hypothetical protein